MPLLRLNLNTHCRTSPEDKERESITAEKIRSVTAIVNNIPNRFFDELQALRPTAIVGAQYFLTDEAWLNRMIELKLPVHCVVQKSRAWLPGRGRSRRPGLMNLYESLTPLPYRTSAVTALGACSSKNKTLLHTKFWVIMGKNDIVTTGEESLVPMAVCLGSYNYSDNAQYNIECMMFVKDPVIALFFYQEYKMLDRFSEPLQWKDKNVISPP